MENAKSGESVLHLTVGTNSRVCLSALVGGESPLHLLSALKTPFWGAVKVHFENARRDHKPIASVLHLTVGPIPECF